MMQRTKIPRGATETSAPLCASCGGLCWTDNATAACGDCGGKGVLVEPQTLPRKRRHARAGRHRLDDRTDSR